MHGTRIGNPSVVKVHNAKRLWSSVGLALEKDILPNENISPDQSLVNLMEVTNNAPFEIVKSMIFKLLIQIDRSKNITLAQLNKHIIYWVHIDMIANNNRIKNNKYLNKSYNKIIHCLGLN